MANPTGAKRGPNGRRLCKWCGTETKPPRICWCSDECVHEYKIRSHSGYARHEVYERDKGVCVLCGLNCSKLKGKLRRMPYQCRRTYLALLGFTRWPMSLWQADHIVPVVEGGGSCGLENLRTLCWRCHRQETRKLRARLSRRRRVKKAKPSSGKLKARARGL